MCAVVLLVLMSTGASMLSLSLFRSSVARSAKESDQALVIAEAGLDQAIYELQVGADVGGDGIGNAVSGIGEGSFVVDVAPPFAGAGNYTLRSVGTVNGIRRAVAADVRAQSRFTGFFAADGVTMNGFLTDSYDSNAGTYASQVAPGSFYADTNGHLQSNADVDVNPMFMVYGDATPGPTGMVIGDTAKVFGSTTPAAAERSLDPYTYSPSVGTSGPTTGTQTLNSGVHRFDMILLQGSDVMTIDGDVELWVDGDFAIVDSARAELTPGSTLTLHHGNGELRFNGGGLVNSDEDPNSVSIESETTKQIEIGASAPFFGSLYAPESDVSLLGGPGFFGATVSRLLTVAPGGALHYDVDLEQLGGATFEIALVRPTRP